MLAWEHTLNGRSEREMIKQADKLSVWRFTHAQFYAAMLLLVALRIEWDTDPVVVVGGQDA